MPQSRIISTSPLGLSESSSIFNPTSNSEVSKHWRSYLPLWLLLNTVVWLPILLYLKVAPLAYTSQWTFTINSNQSSTKVSLPGIGDASSSSNSPFSSHLADPRETYRLLLGTDEVLTEAAQELKISTEAFGKPRTKILDNSTLMKLEIKGSTPEVAQKKAIAIQAALENKLEQLRNEEVIQQSRRAEKALVKMERKLKDAQQRLYTYKASSALTSVEQLRDLSVNVEDLRRQQAGAVANFQQVNSRVNQLSKNLGLSAQQAADALTLRSDRLFQEYLLKYSQASAELVTINSRFTAISPPVHAKQVEQATALAALLNQGQMLFGRPVSQAELQPLILAGSGSSGASAERANLFQSLISLQADQQGMQAQAQGLNQQIIQLEARLSRLAQEESKLDALQRDVKIAEAIFASNLTKIDLDQSSVSATYPPISILDKPSFPKKQSEPKTKYALLGATIGSVFMTAGILALQWRDKRIQKKRKFGERTLEDSIPESTFNEEL